MHNKTKIWNDKFFLIFVFVAIVLSVFFHFAYENIADPDSFYHIRHAALYKEGSLVASNFPWTSASAIGAIGSDIWYGFHLLLIPFTLFSDLTTGIRVAGVILTTLFLITLAFFGKSTGLRLPYFWPLVALFAIPNAMYFFVMVRPHILSLLGGILLLFFLARKQWKVVFVTAFGITFFHGSFFWLPFFILCPYIVALVIIHKKEFRAALSWRIIGVTIIGTLAGVLARPEPWGGVKLAYIQIIELVRVSLRDVPLIGGEELLPLSWTLFTTCTVFLFVWGGAITYGLVRRKKFVREVIGEEPLIITLSTALISFVFFLLATFVAMRFFVYWVSFGTLCIGLIYSYGIERSFFRGTRQFAPLLLLLFLIPYGSYRHNLNERYVATQPTKFQDASAWLEEHSAPGDIVFNTHWDQFAPLFFRNQKNYYIGGMDPIFQFAYDERKYWIFHYIAIDAASELTCVTFPCTKDKIVLTYETLKSDFNPRYIFVEPRRNPVFIESLGKDSRFKEVYRDSEATLFEIL